MATPSGTPKVTPERIFATLHGYQRSAALKAAIELELFTALGRGAKTAASLAQSCKSAERGVRILADYLVIDGFLTKAPAICLVSRVPCSAIISSRKLT